MKMTYRQALEIQQRQAVWYRQRIGRKGLKAIRAKTKPCPIDMSPDTLVPVSKINGLIPRGIDFEQYIINTGPTDPLTYNWYQAMETKKIYSS